MGLIKRRARKLIRQKIRQPARAAIRGAAERWCPNCQKRVQPFHTCVIKTDFRKRRTQAERRTRAAKRRTAKTTKGTSAARPRERHQAHPYQTCHDPACQRRACVAFKEGMSACPLPHE